MIVLMLILVLLFPSLSCATSWNKTSGIIHSPTSVVLADDFLSGGTTDGIIGALGWQVSHAGSGSVSVGYTEANHPGVIRINSGAVSGNVSIIDLSEDDTVINPSLLHGADRFSVTGILATGLGLNTSMIMQFGIGSYVNASLTTPGMGAWCEFNPASSANWVCNGSSGGVVTPYTSSIAVTAGTFYKIEIKRTSTGVDFYINSTLIGSYTDATWLADTGTPMVPRFSAETSTIAARAVLVDFFSMTIEGLSR